MPIKTRLLIVAVAITCGIAGIARATPVVGLLVGTILSAGNGHRGCKTEGASRFAHGIQAMKALALFVCRCATRTFRAQQGEIRHLCSQKSPFF
jgi:hypothetical protein